MATKKVEKLAIEGGKKVWSKGFPAWPQFDRKTDKKVLDILLVGFLVELRPSGESL